MGISHAVILSGRIGSAMAEVRVHAAFTVKDEELFLSEAKKMIAATQEEKGCILYQLFKEKGKEKSYAMIETWETAEDLEAHSKSVHVKAFQASQKERENLSLTVQCYSPVSI